MEDSNPSFVFDGDESPAAPKNPDHGWQKVTYVKRQRRPAPAMAAAGDSDRSDAVFASVEQKAKDRRRALESAAAEAALAGSRPAAYEDEDESGGEAPAKENGEAVVVKKVKPKKPKITVADAASRIDAGDLLASLADISVLYELRQDIQLMRFAEYFCRSFASVSSSQFPWAKMFKESPVAKIIDVPMCHISESVYKASADWIAQKSVESLGVFVLVCLGEILDDLANQQAAAKGSKKVVRQSPKAKAGIFVVLSMTLRRKPEILINLLPELRNNPKYQGPDKLPFIVWTIAQASQGDLVVGMYSWIHYLLPLVCGKSNVNPQSRDFALQLVERILSGPKTRAILLNGAVRKGERLVPPSALDSLMRASYPVPSARIKATERFVAVYPILKEIALAGTPGTKTTKQASQQFLPFAVKALQESNPELTKEAADIFIWCLTQNADCYKQWEKLYLENIGASISVLRKLCDEWKECSAKLAPLDDLRGTIKHLREKNEEALAGEGEANYHASIKESDKYCKVILRRSKRSSSCMRGGVCMVAVAVAAAFFLSPNMELLGWEKLHSMVSSVGSF